MWLLRNGNENLTIIVDDILVIPVCLRSTFFFITTRKTAIISEKKMRMMRKFFFFLLFYFPHTHTYAIFNGFFFLFFASPLFIPFSSNSKHIPFDDFVRTFHFSCFSPSIREIIFFPLLFFPFSPIQQHGTISFRFQMQNWHFTLYKNYISSTDYSMGTLSAYD